MEFLYTEWMKPSQKKRATQIAQKGQEHVPDVPPAVPFFTHRGLKVCGCREVAKTLQVETGVCNYSKWEARQCVTQNDQTWHDSMEQQDWLQEVMAWTSSGGARALPSLGLIVGMHATLLSVVRFTFLDSFAT